MGTQLQACFPAWLALALPVVAGCTWMAFAGAPHSYLAINAAALTLAGLWVWIAPSPASTSQQRIVIIVLLALMFVPLMTGPAINGIARWLPLGAFQLHSGMLIIPALAVLAVREPDFAAPILLIALFAALLQPDAASGFALTFAAVGMHDVTKRWQVGLVVVVGFIASLVMAIRGELPAQPFVERVLVDAAATSLAVTLALLAALIGSFFLILYAAPLARAERFALAGSLFGFATMATLSHYPTPLIGYGAAPIFGYALAMGLARGQGTHAPTTAATGEDA